MPGNGGYNALDRTVTEYYGDAILSAAKSFGKFNLNVLAGSALQTPGQTGSLPVRHSLYSQCIHHFKT